MGMFDRRPMRKGKWTDGKITVWGEWEYQWSSDRFLIVLDSRDPITGEQRRMVVSGDMPEWGKFKLIDE